MNEELNNYVKGNKRINIFNMIKVCKLVENMAIDEIRKIGFSEPMYKIYCCRRDFRGYAEWSVSFERNKSPFI